jgi:hypothetical protein
MDGMTMLIVMDVAMVVLLLVAEVVALSARRVDDRGAPKAFAEFRCDDSGGPPPASRYT